MDFYDLWANSSSLMSVTVICAIMGMFYAPMLKAAAIMFAVTSVYTVFSVARVYSKERGHHLKYRRSKSMEAH